MGAANWTAACCSSQALSQGGAETIHGVSWSTKPLCCSSSSTHNPSGTETLIATEGGAYPSIGAEMSPPAVATCPAAAKSQQCNDMYAKPETVSMGGGDMKSSGMESACKSTVREWDATVSKGDHEPLGMELRIHDGGISICDIRDGGAVSVANDLNGSDRQMRLGDHLVAVNGITGEADELIGHMKGSPLRFTMRRYSEFRVNMPNGCILGADIKDDDGNFKVVVVGEGFLAEYNEESAPAGCEVVVGDRLIRVRGSPTSKNLLLELVSQSDGGVTELVFSR